MSRLRSFVGPFPQPGELIVGRDEGGARHFLDGRPVTCGSTLVLIHNGEALRLVRYESAGPVSPSSARLYYGQDGTDTVVATDRFRWPTKEELIAGSPATVRT